MMIHHPHALRRASVASLITGQVGHFSTKRPGSILKSAEGDAADEFFNGYKLRLPSSAVFADYAIGHLKRLLGSKMRVDFDEAVVIKHQNDRLDEGTARKTIMETKRHHFCRRIRMVSWLTGGPSFRFAASSAINRTLHRARPSGGGPQTKTTIRCF